MVPDNKDNEWGVGAEEARALASLAKGITYTRWWESEIDGNIMINEGADYIPVVEKLELPPFEYDLMPETLMFEDQRIRARRLPRERIYGEVGVQVEGGQVVGLGIPMCRTNDDWLDAILTFKHLRTLNLAGNGLCRLPDQLSTLSELRALSVGGNYLKELPASFARLQGLRDLRLLSNPWQEFPAPLLKLPSLRILDLSYCPDAMSDALGLLPALEVLILARCMLDKFPETVLLLRSLRRLDLSRNNLPAVPEEICKLRALEFLNLMLNQISELPATLAQLPVLRVLDVCMNILKGPLAEGSLPSSLQRLILSGNQLPTIPSSIGELRSLQQLELGGNGLTALPDSLGALQNLQVLDLTWNGLTALPDSLGALRALQELYLEENQLTTLPPTFWQLQGLTFLSLGVNRGDSGRSNNWQGTLRGLINLYAWSVEGDKEGFNGTIGGDVRETRVGAIRSFLRGLQKLSRGASLEELEEDYDRDVLA